jgi:hypothetical protein
MNRLEPAIGPEETMFHCRRARMGTIKAPASEGGRYKSWPAITEGLASRPN